MRGALLGLLALAACRPDPSPRPAVSDADRYLRRLEKLGFGGAVLIAKAGKILLTDAYGLADQDQGRPNTVDTLFPIGKPATAAVALHLAARGYARGQLCGGDGPYTETGAHSTVGELFRQGEPFSETCYPFACDFSRSDDLDIIVLSNVAEFPATVIGPYLARLVKGEPLPLPPDVIDYEPAPIQPGRYETADGVQFSIRREGRRLLLGGEALYPTSPSEFATYDLQTGKSVRVIFGKDSIQVGELNARKIER
jgi:hypothetical protein